MSVQEAHHASNFGDCFARTLEIVGGRPSVGCRLPIVARGADIPSEASSHVVGLPLVMLEATSEFATVLFCTATAVFAVEVFPSTRPKLSLELFVAARVGTGGLEDEELGVISTPSYANYVAGHLAHPSRASLFARINPLLILCMLAALRLQHTRPLCPGL